MGRGNDDTLGHVALPVLRTRAKPLYVGNAKSGVPSRLKSAVANAVFPNPFEGAAKYKGDVNRPPPLPRNTNKPFDCTARSGMPSPFKSRIVTSEAQGP